MADTIEIVQGTATVVEVAGPTGPQGPQGASQADVLTTKGDLLTRGTSAAERLAIGTAGQILKVSASGMPEWGAAPASGVTSVNGQTGAVTVATSAQGALADTASQPGHTHISYSEIVDSLLDGGEQILADIGAAASSHTHTASAISDSTTAGRALLTAADAAAQRTSLGLGTLATQSGTFSGTSSGTNTGDQTISLTGDVTGSGTGSFAATIASNAVTNAKLAQVATSTIKGRATASTGNVEDLTATQVRALLNVADGATANSSDATLLARANHTGTQAASTITGLAAIATSGSASDLGSGTVPIARIPTGTSSTTVALGDHTHSQLHDRSHAMTGTSDHTATAWRTFYSNGSGQVTELALGAANTVLTSNGASSAPSFAALPAGGSKTYFRATALDNQPPAASSFATLDTRNSIAVLDFDAASDENAVFVGVMPEGAVLTSGLTVYLHWMATSATSGNVRWGAQLERSNTDLDSDSFDTATEANGAASGTSGIVTVTAITLTSIDGVTAGDLFRLKVYRNADDVTNDTMTGDAELVAVEVRSAA